MDGDCFEVWSSHDSLVLKAVSIVLSRQWNGVLSHRCFHLAGRGGAKAALLEVVNQVHHTDDHHDSRRDDLAPNCVVKWGNQRVIIQNRDRC